jgi:hypothetical protein
MSDPIFRNFDSPDGLFRAQAARCIRGPAGRSARLLKIEFPQPFQSDRPVPCLAHKYFTSVFQNNVISSFRPASTKGAFRDRHERGRRDAMAAWRV